jgi:hypothetical protein
MLREQGTTEPHKRPFLEQGSPDLIPESFEDRKPGDHGAASRTYAASMNDMECFFNFSKCVISMPTYVVIYISSRFIYQGRSIGPPLRPLYVAVNQSAILESHLSPFPILEFGDMLTTSTRDFYLRCMTCCLLLGTDSPYSLTRVREWDHGPASLQMVLTGCPAQQCDCRKKIGDSFI